MEFKRILLKLSGESLKGRKESGIDFNRVLEIAGDIKEFVEEANVEVGIVVGGGNFWRGRQNTEMDSCTSDQIGMLATTMNALALDDAFRQLGVESRVQTGIEMRQISEFYIRKRAIRHLEKGRIVIFGCGTGSPFFSTDTAAALRASEIRADLIIKGTNVDGVFDKDPNKYDDAIKYDEINYLDVINKGLKVMDTTAISLCMEQNIPILVLNIFKKGNLKIGITDSSVGTLVK